MKIGIIDIIVILVYLVGIVTVGLLSARSKEKRTGEGYFLGGRGLKWGGGLYRRLVGGTGNRVMLHLEQRK